MIESDNNKVVHLFGPSGAGKTSFINIIANHQFNQNSNQLLAIIPTRFISEVYGDFNAPEENEINNTNVSKTNKCTPYSFPNGFTFIDSPPIGDTRKEREFVNTQNIIESFIKLEKVNCTIIVLNGTTPRLTCEIQDSLRKILESFPNTMANNFVFLFTNCYQETSNFNIQELGMDKFIKPNQENIFYIKNPFFSQNPTTWSENAKKSLKREWDSCMETLDEIFKYINTLPKVSTLDFKTVSDSKDSVLLSLNNFYTLINEYEKCNDEIEKTKKKKNRNNNLYSVDNSFDSDKNNNNNNNNSFSSSKKKIIENMNEKKNSLKEIISKDFNSIRTKCLELSEINSDLNIVNQLHSTLKSLHFECRKMVHQDTRNLAEQFIHPLNCLIEEIEKKKSIGINSYSGTTCSNNNNNNIDFTTKSNINKSISKKINNNNNNNRSYSINNPRNQPYQHQSYQKPMVQQYQHYNNNNNGFYNNQNQPIKYDEVKKIDDTNQISNQYNNNQHQLHHTIQPYQRVNLNKFSESNNNQNIQSNSSELYPHPNTLTQMNNNLNNYSELKQNQSSLETYYPKLEQMKSPPLSETTIINQHSNHIIQPSQMNYNNIENKFNDDLKPTSVTQYSNQSNASLLDNTTISSPQSNPHNNQTIQKELLIKKNLILEKIDENKIKIDENKIKIEFMIKENEELNNQLTEINKLIN